MSDIERFDIVLKILTDIIDPPYVDIKVGQETLRHAAREIIQVLFHDTGK